MIKSIKDAPLYTKDVVILECNSLRARVIAQQLSTLEEAIVELDAKIAQIMATHQEAPLFRKVRGAGAALAPRLLTVFGTDREKFSKADEVACLTGIAPVTNKAAIATPFSEDARATQICSRPFMSSLVQLPSGARGVSLLRDVEGKGMKRHAILRKLAYKWIRILFRCWKTSTEYDPQRYEAIIKTKTPEIVQYFPKTKQKSTQNRLTRTQKSPWFHLPFAFMQTDEADDRPNLVAGSMAERLYSKPYCRCKNSGNNSMEPKSSIVWIFNGYPILSDLVIVRVTEASHMNGLRNTLRFLRKTAVIIWPRRTLSSDYS